MIKKLIVVVSLFVGFFAFSQENTASPYSFYGIGEIKFRGTEAERAMGGLSIKGDSITVNLLNPASYSHLKLTNFAVGGTTTFATLKNATTSEQAKRTTFDYIAVSIPMGKFGASVGLVPLSAVGYKLENNSVTDNVVRKRSYSGTGNLNKLYFGGAYNLNKNLSFGLNFEYNFGVLDNKIIDLKSNVFYATRETNEARVKGMSFKLGALYNKKINDKLDLYSGITFQPEAKLNVDNQQVFSLVTITTSGSEVPYDALEPNFSSSKITIPTKFSLGAGVGEKNKWLLGADLAFVNSKKQNNIFDTDTDYSYKNGQTFVVGGYYIPDYDSFSSYLNRIVYRAGFRYENTGLIVNDKDINNYGMNFGLGLPLGNSKLDLGFEFGKRGTTTNNLIQENYFNLSVGISISDKWFRKVLID